mgnify:CR=1 FL=1
MNASKLLVALCAGVLAVAAPVLRAQTTEVSASMASAMQSPDALVQKVSNDVLEAVKADKAMQAGDVKKLNALIETKVLPYVNFQRMTASSVGPQWRSATRDQQKRMLFEFQTLMVNTYSGALTQVKDQAVVVKPLRAAADQTELVVRSEVRGKGEPAIANDTKS